MKDKRSFDDLIMARLAEHFSLLNSFQPTFFPLFMLQN